MRDLFKELVEEKGFSAKWTTFEKPTKRYIVGISGLKFEFTGLETEFKKALNLFFENYDNFEDTFGFGAWIDDLDPKILYLDKIVETDSLDEAFELADRYDQIAIFDNKIGKAIYRLI